MIDNQQPITVHGLQGVDLTMRSRVRSADQTLVTSGDVLQLYRQVFGEQGDLVDNTALDPGNHFFDQLQTGPAWTCDDVGFNFQATLPGPLLSDANQRYDIYFWCVPTAGGSDFPLWFRVGLTPVAKAAYPIP